MDGERVEGGGRAYPHNQYTNNQSSTFSSIFSASQIVLTERDLYTPSVRSVQVGNYYSLRHYKTFKCVQQTSGGKHIALSIDG